MAKQILGRWKLSDETLCHEKNIAVIYDYNQNQSQGALRRNEYAQPLRGKTLK